MASPAFEVGRFVDIYFYHLTNHLQSKILMPPSLIILMQYMLCKHYNAVKPGYLELHGTRKIL